MFGIASLTLLVYTLNLLVSMSPDFIYSVIYVILALCLIAPPVEFVSIGLTIQNLFSSFLGSEEMNFIFYHIKRTTCTYIFHSIIPLGKLYVDKQIVIYCANRGHTFG